MIRPLAPELDAQPVTRADLYVVMRLMWLLTRTVLLAMHTLGRTEALRSADAYTNYTIRQLERSTSQRYTREE
jgi:hypothetical protein